MVWHVAFGQLTYNIGGFFPMMSFPQCPVVLPTDVGMITYQSAAMNWLIFAGSDDEIYDAGEAQAVYQQVFTDLGIGAAIKYEGIADNLGHEPDSRAFDVMMKYILDGVVGDIDDFVHREWIYDSYYYEHYSDWYYWYEEYGYYYHDYGYYSGYHHYSYYDHYDYYDYSQSSDGDMRRRRGEGDSEDKVQDGTGIVVVISVAMAAAFVYYFLL